MAMRITTNGIFYGYRKNLGNSYYQFSKAMSRVTTQRNFESYAEDVSAASRAFQLRRSHWRAENQITNSNYVISKFETAWSAIDYIVDGEGMDDNLNSIVESLRGLNDPSGSARITLGESVLAKAESIVRLLNTQYGDQFIFAGEDGRNVPFTWELDARGNTYLAYRGMDVSVPVPIMSAEEFKEHIQLTSREDIDYSVDPPLTYSTWSLNYDAGLISQGFEMDGAGTFDSLEDAQQAYDDFVNNKLEDAYQAYLDQFNEQYQDYTHGAKNENGEDMSPYEYYMQLVTMSQEATYVDIGIGVQWEARDPNAPEKIPDLISSSAYNSALNGLNFLGFGSTIGEDGELHSNNLAMLMYEMGSMLKSCDTATGQYPEGWDPERVAGLTRKIEASVNDVTVQHVKLANDTKYLQTNLAQLTAQRDNLNTQIMEIEQIDPADAITEFMYARYSYNAALSVGGTILTNTLLDYLR